jgi:hypothetical protein
LGIIMKAKPIILVAITLIIGFAIGMLTSAQLRIHRLKPVRMYFSEERFRDGFYKIIEPDEKQKAEIDKILQKYARINGDLQSEIRKQLDSNMKEFRKELDAKLTKEQIARLKAIDERRQEMIRQGWRDFRDSSNNNDDRRRYDRRQFPDGQPMRHEGRPYPSEGMPPGGRQMPPRDSVPSPDGK